ncbi:MAG: hypothetical protein EXS15_01460 [Phycisphaerales bacterium]|nr:hypothetical protein [Phycisphaerales bacterium]
MGYPAPPMSTRAESAQSKRRVIITGNGPVSGFGVGMEPLWKGLCAGESAIRPITSFDPSGFISTAAAMVTPEQLDIRTIVPKNYRKATKVMARDIEIAVAAAASAVHSARLTTRGTAEGVTPTIAPQRVGCHIGAGLIPADSDELASAMLSCRDAQGGFDPGEWGRTGMANLTPLWLLKYLPNMLACHVTIIHDCQGPSNTLTCAEASGGLSIGESMRVIRRGDADACLSGGAESKVNYMGLLRQTFAHRLAPVPTGADGCAAVRPFDDAAQGTVLGEGGGILITEAFESAHARGAHAIAELVGFAARQCSCIDTVGVDLCGADEDIACAIEAALHDGAVRADEIDAIVPFGSGIPNVDAAEAKALRAIFGDRTSTIPLITLAPQIGICGAGTSALSVSVAAQCLLMQQLPARLSTVSSAQLQVDAVARSSRHHALGTILVTTTGMGGQSVALVLRRMT